MMLRKIIETIFSKGITAISNFATVIITSAYLGAAIRGEIALLLLSVNIVNLFQVILGGPALAYLSPNHSVRDLAGLAFIWNLLFGFLVSWLLVILQLLPMELFNFVLVISILQGILSIIQNLLIGKDEISKQNILEIIRALIVTGFIVFALTMQHYTDVAYVYYAYVLANSIVALIGIIFLWPYLVRSVRIDSLSTLFRKMANFGFQVQFNNISQIINYRFVYYLIEKWKGLEALGIFSVAVSIGEATWVICRSIATFQTSKVVNEKDPKKQVTLTILMSKLSIVLTLVALIVLFLLPTSLYIWLLRRPEFSDIKFLLACFSGGIFFLAIFTIFNHYFTATNQNIVNIRASLFGNLVTIPTGIILIHWYSIYGGALTYTVVNLAMLVYLFYQFKKRTRSRLSHFTLRKEDFRIFSQH